MRLHSMVMIRAVVLQYEIDLMMLGTSILLVVDVATSEFELTVSLTLS